MAIPFWRPLVTLANQRGGARGERERLIGRRVRLLVEATHHDIAGLSALEGWESVVSSLSFSRSGQLLGQFR